CSPGSTRAAPGWSAGSPTGCSDLPAPARVPLPALARVPLPALARVPLPALARFFGEALEPFEGDRAAVVVGDGAGEGAEHLVGLAAEAVLVAHLAVLVEAGGERHVELPVGVADPPRRHRVVPVVVPQQLAGDLGEAAVEEEAVLGEAAALGPLGAELQADHHVTGPAGAAAPVPPDLRRPAAPPDVQDA